MKKKIKKFKKIIKKIDLEELGIPPQMVAPYDERQMPYVIKNIYNNDKKVFRKFLILFWIFLCITLIVFLIIKTF